MQATEGADLSLLSASPAAWRSAVLLAPPSRAGLATARRAYAVWNALPEFGLVDAG